MPPKKTAPRPQPIDSEQLQLLALRYVERYATTQTKLFRYLQRKIRERGWGGMDAAPVADLVARLAALGYVSDRSYGEARARSLDARGFGRRRIGQELRAAGIEEALRTEIADAQDARAALARLARRRRFGPYAETPPDDRQRQKQLAAMLRAGHAFDLVRELLDAPSVQAFEADQD